MNNMTIDQTIAQLAVLAQQGDSNAQDILDVLAQDELQGERHAVQHAMVDNAPQWDTLATGDMFNVTHLARWRDGVSVEVETLATVEVDHAPAVTRTVGEHATRNIGDTSAVRDTPVVPMNTTDKGETAVRSSATEVVRGDSQKATMVVLAPQVKPAVPFHPEKLEASEAARVKAADKEAFPWMFNAAGVKPNFNGRQWRNAMTSARKRMPAGPAVKTTAQLPAATIQVRAALPAIQVKPGMRQARRPAQRPVVVRR